tara:strand:+ start:170752 stop:171438 length:687 start_codon:yes stop_codon:yes gene_type:complete
MFKIVVSFILVLLVGCSSTPAVKNTGIDPITQARVEQWKSLIDTGSQWSDIKKLTSVNDFVNQLTFVDDIIHWKQEDYWATPLQTLVTKGGDCEDFAIAKYFTLSAMGMDEDKMRLTYVKALTINKAHMVVSYFERPNAEPLVLDNLNRNIVVASARKDLIPVYSFNGTGLWLTKRDRQDLHVDDASRLSLWQDLLHHMDVEAANENAMICLYQYYDLPSSKAKTMCP